MTVAEAIRTKLTDALAPAKLTIIEMTFFWSSSRRVARHSGSSLPPSQTPAQTSAANATARYVLTRDGYVLTQNSSLSNDCSLSLVDFAQHAPTKEELF